MQVCLIPQLRPQTDASLVLQVLIQQEQMPHLVAQWHAAQVNKQSCLTPQLLTQTDALLVLQVLNQQEQMPHLVAQWHVTLVNKQAYLTVQLQTQKDALLAVHAFNPQEQILHHVAQLQHGTINSTELTGVVLIHFLVIINVAKQDNHQSICFQMLRGKQRCSYSPKIIPT